MTKDFKIIRPVTVTDAVLKSSNIAENDHTAYDTTAVYGDGEKVRVVAANTHDVYESLQGTAATVAVSIGSPCSVTWNGHGQAANKPVKFATTGALPTGLTAGQTYYVLSPSANSFNISATPGGAAINTSGSQSGVHTATANDIGKTPADNPTYWQYVGKTNRHKMFDQSVQSQSSNPDSVSVVLSAASRANSVFMFNINAASARIKQTDPVDGLVYDKTYSLIDDSGINDPYAYCFEPIDRVTDLIVTDLFPYANADIEVTLSDPGGTVLVGVLGVGQSRDIGELLRGLRAGIQDYSIKERDSFGNYKITERTYSKRRSFSVLVENTLIDRLENLLAEYRATPVVYVGSGKYGIAANYGFYKDFDIDVAYTDKSLLAINTEGLT